MSAPEGTPVGGGGADEGPRNHAVIQSTNGASRTPVNGPVDGSDKIVALKEACWFASLLGESYPQVSLTGATPAMVEWLHVQGDGYADGPYSTPPQATLRATVYGVAVAVTCTKSRQREGFDLICALANGGARCSMCGAKVRSCPCTDAQPDLHPPEPQAA